jgi:hypothetical protein
MYPSHYYSSIWLALSQWAANPLDGNITLFEVKGSHNERLNGKVHLTTTATLKRLSEQKSESSW